MITSEQYADELRSVAERIVMLKGLTLDLVDQMSEIEQNITLGITNDYAN